MAVISFTADDGRPDQLESDAIVRVRRILGSERQQHNANTKIVWSRDSYAKETPAAFIGLLTSVEGVSKWLGGSPCRKALLYGSTANCRRAPSG